MLNFGGVLPTCGSFFFLRGTSREIHQRHRSRPSPRGGGDFGRPLTALQKHPTFRPRVRGGSMKSSKYKAVYCIDLVFNFMIYIYTLRKSKSRLKKGNFTKSTIFEAEEFESSILGDYFFS